MFGMFLQYLQIELYYVLIDDYIRIVVGKLGVEFFQQLWVVGDVFQFKIECGGVVIFWFQYINDVLFVVFQVDVVQFIVVGGFNINRNLFEWWMIVGMWFQMGINDSVIVYIIFDLYW